MTNSETVCTFVRRRKADLIKLFGGKCCICGFDKYQEGFDFHHVNPEEKEFSITSSNMKNLNAQLEELKKCILVCSNCHRGIHSGYYEVPENWQELYNEDWANQLRENLQLVQHGKIHCCQKCGKIVTRKATFCQDCLHENQRRAEHPSKEELKKLIRTKPFAQIGRDFGVSDNAIRKWCKKYNLPHKKTEIMKFSDQEWLEI